MTIPESLKAHIREQAGNRCGYCLSSQDYVMGLLEIEHILPKSRGGTDEEENLWLACRLCNGYKGTQTEAVDPTDGSLVSIFNPRLQIWKVHFAWSKDGTEIIGQTACGRATVNALRLNNPVSMTVRRSWVSAGWHPPKDEE